MHRVAILFVVFLTAASFGTFSVFAQSPSSAGKSSGEIAARSRALAQKQEDCRLQAKQQKLSYLKRRRFVRECLKKP